MDMRRRRRKYCKDCKVEMIFDKVNNCARFYCRSSDPDCHVIYVNIHRYGPDEWVYEAQPREVPL